MKLIFSFFIISIFIHSTAAHSKILFEGYYKMDLSGKHVGYVIQRYEFLKEKGEYKSTSYTYLGLGKTKTIESLKASASKDFKPLKYKYEYSEVKANTEIHGKQIDAQFKGLNMSGTSSSGIIKKGIQLPKDKINIKIKKDSILSTFLTHKILATNLKNKTNYPFSAIAEEDGELYSGFAKTVGKESMHGKTLFKLQNNFKNSEFMSLMDSFGHIYQFNSPKIQLRGTLVKSAKEATLGFEVNNESLKKLFNNIPVGQSNNLVKSKK